MDIDWQFHPKQLKAFQSEARYVMVNSGRRGGKGKLGARKVWEEASQDPWSKLKTNNPEAVPQILITATTYPQIRDTLVPNLNVELPKGFAHYNKSEHIYYCDNGCQVLLRSIDNPEPLRGLGEFVIRYWGDEFALYPTMVWDEILRYCIVDNIAPVLFTSTPKGAGKFKELSDKGIGGDKGYDYYHWTSYENIFLPEGALDEFEDLPINIYNQEVLAQFIDDFGGVFRGIKEIVAGDWEDTIQGESYSAGLDLAKHEDFTVLKIMKDSTKQVVYSNRFQSHDWDVQYDIIEADLKRYNNALCWMDSTGIGDPIFDNLNKRGLRLHGFKIKSNEVKANLIGHLIIAVNEKAFTHPDDPIWTNEMKIFQAETLPISKLIRYAAPAGYHDDEVIATALMAWGGIKRRVDYSNMQPSAGGERVFS